MSIDTNLAAGDGHLADQQSLPSVAAAPQADAANVANAAVLASQQGPVEIGIISAIQDDGTLWVTRASDTEPVPAQTIVKLDRESVGRSAVLCSVAGGADVARQVVVLGLLERPNSAPSSPNTSPAESKQEESSKPEKTPLQVTADGQTVTVSAERELVLQCGKASITLTRAGKILIRGAYLSSRSSGVNRIKGGAVHIN